MTIELKAPAKINLFLRVVGRRRDGYHELRSLMCCIDLFDRLVIAFGGEKNRIICTDQRVPEDGTNLALQAAEAFQRTLLRETGCNPDPLSIYLTKRIPVGAGLGGGSSDAAAILLGLNRHYGHPFGKDRLRVLALELGADVPFFIEAKPAFIRGIGEQLNPYHGLDPLGILLVYPGFGVSTRWAFANLTLRLTKCEKKIRNFPFNNGAFCVTRHLSNDLEAVVQKQHPVIGQIKNQLLGLGALGALMSGSGSSVFGLFTDKAAAQNAVESFMARADWQVFATEIMR